MKAYQRFVMALVACALLGVTVVGCNTFKGAGQDLQKGGQTVEDVAKAAERNP